MTSTHTQEDLLNIVNTWYDSKRKLDKYEDLVIMKRYLKTLEHRSHKILYSNDYKFVYYDYPTAINIRKETIFKLNFNVIPNEIKEIYLKYIDNGIYKGKLHIYDKYNRCLLSNEKKSDIEAKTYTMQDYKRIESIINSSNQIIIKKEVSEFGEISEFGKFGEISIYDKEQYGNNITTCISQEGHKKHVQDELKKTNLSKYNYVYLCGNSKMIIDVQNLLQKTKYQGIVKTEVFF